MKIIREAKHIGSCPGISSFRQNDVPQFLLIPILHCIYIKRVSPLINNQIQGYPTVLFAVSTILIQILLFNFSYNVQIMGEFASSALDYD